MVVGKFSNGQRRTYRRIFLKMPVILPVNVKTGSMEKKFNVKCIPDVITVHSADSVAHKSHLLKISLCFKCSIARKTKRNR